jgi:hypothetical protein
MLSFPRTLNFFTPSVRNVSGEHLMLAREKDSRFECQNLDFFPQYIFLIDFPSRKRISFEGKSRENRWKIDLRGLPASSAVQVMLLGAQLAPRGSDSSHRQVF